jgi:hypothetical protein
VTPALKEGSALQLPGYRWFGMRNLLMVAQVTGSLTLLLITGFLVIGISMSSTIQTKFDPHNMYLLSIDPVRDGYTADQAQVLFDKLPEQLKTVNGVRNVAMAEQAPFTLEDEDRAIQLTAEDSRSTAQIQIAGYEEIVSARYFAALNEPILAGREFSELDQRSQSNESKALPAVLNESAVRAFFKNENAIGERVKDDKQSYEVVGVVHDLTNGAGIRQPIVYLPLTNRDLARPPADGMTYQVPSDGRNTARSHLPSPS